MIQSLLSQVLRRLRQARNSRPVFQGEGRGRDLSKASRPEFDAQDTHVGEEIWKLSSGLHMPSLAPVYILPQSIHQSINLKKTRKKGREMRRKEGRTKQKEM